MGHNKAAALLESLLLDQLAEMVAAMLADRQFERLPTSYRAAVDIVESHAGLEPATR